MGHYQSFSQAKAVHSISLVLSECSLGKLSGRSKNELICDASIGDSAIALLKKS